MDSDGAFICLVTIDDFAAFLRDKDGKLNQYMLEPNVRDYQGDVAVNNDIRDTLQSNDSNEFWWLNITVLLFWPMKHNWVPE